MIVNRLIPSSKECGDMYEVTTIQKGIESISQQNASINRMHQSIACINDRVYIGSNLFIHLPNSLSYYWLVILVNLSRWLHNINIKDRNNCELCNNVDDPPYFFLYCSSITEFWKYWINWLENISAPQLGHVLALNLHQHLPPDLLPHIKWSNDLNYKES